MSRFNEQLKKQADSLKLSWAEKRDLRSRLVSYMEYHPLPQELRTSQLSSAKTPFTRIAFFRSVYTHRTATAFVVMLLASVPFVAERAVPGDVLYPIKVSFNEEVRSTLTRSPYEKVEWETERLERRLAEARLLAREGKLTPEVEHEVAEAVKLHSDEAQKGIASLRESDSDEAALAEIAFSSALDVQSEMLEGHSDALVGAVDAAREVAEASQETNKPSYAKLLARIELESTNAYELFDTVAEQASEQEREDIERKLRDIKRSVTNAIRLEKLGTTGEAVQTLTTALADTRKVISFMTNLDVRESVSIDELIPANVTDEERRALLQTRIDEIKALDVVIRNRIVDVDINTQTAVTNRLDEMNVALALATSSLEANMLDDADDASLSAYTIGLELQTVLDTYDETMGTSTSTSTSTTTVPEASIDTEVSATSTST